MISGIKTIAGQHNQESKDGNPFEPALSTDNIYEITGRYPGLWSGDFLYQSGYTDFNTRMRMIDEAINQWDHGAIVNIMWHACPPTQREPCDWQGGVKSHLNDWEWDDLITNGTELNNLWKFRLDEIAEYLQVLKNEGVEVLWRPFHEMNQGKFWWGGRRGSEGTARLYQITYDYLVDEWDLTNLIWVWNVQDFDTLAHDLYYYNPGDDYWDIATLDIYRSDGFTQEKYEAMLSIAGNKPIAIGECWCLPTAQELYEQTLWVFFMGWAECVFHHNLEEEIIDLYNAPNVLTLEEVSHRIY